MEPSGFFDKQMFGFNCSLKETTQCGIGQIEDALKSMQHFAKITVLIQEKLNKNPQDLARCTELLRLVGDMNCKVLKKSSEMRNRGLDLNIKTISQNMRDMGIDRMPALLEAQLAGQIADNGNQALVIHQNEMELVRWLSRKEGEIAEYSSGQMTISNQKMCQAIESLRAGAMKVTELFVRVLTDQNRDCNLAYQEHLQAQTKIVVDGYLATADQMLLSEVMIRDESLRRCGQAIDWICLAQVKQLGLLTERISLLQSKKDHELQISTVFHCQKMKEQIQENYEMAKRASFSMEENGKEWRRSIETRTEKLKQENDDIEFRNVEWQMEFKRIDMEARYRKEINVIQQEIKRCS